MSDVDAKYYVVFMDSDKARIRWLKRGYRHCLVARLEYGKIWTVIQDSKTHLDVSTYLVETYPTVYNLTGSNDYIEFNPVDHDKYRLSFPHFNCVEVCKAVLGISKPFIITPYQLYRWLHEQST